MPIPRCSFIADVGLFREWLATIHENSSLVPTYQQSNKEAHIEVFNQTKVGDVLAIEYIDAGVSCGEVNVWIAGSSRFHPLIANFFEW